MRSTYKEKKKCRVEWAKVTYRQQLTLKTDGLLKKKEGLPLGVPSNLAIKEKFTQLCDACTETSCLIVTI